MPTRLSRCRPALAALGFIGTFASWSSEAAACSPPPIGWNIVLQNAELPSDGYLIIRLYCSVDCGSGPSEPSITVRDVASGNEVPGTIAPLTDVDESQHLYVWHATDPLVAGADYEVEYPILTMSRTLPIEVVSPGTPDLDTLGLETTIGPVEVDAGELVCCPSGPLDSCGGAYCFRDQVQRAVSITLDWSRTTDAARFGQYLSRVIWEGAGEPKPWNIGLSATGRFETEQSEYCYTLELKSLIDGSIERLDGACVAHPEDLELGVFDVDPATIRGQLGVCDEPPEGKEADWCDARAARCAEFPVTQCTNLEELCPEEPGSGGSGGRGGTGGAGGTAGTGGTGDAGNAGTAGEGGEAGDAGEGGRTRRIVTDRGCSVARAGGSRRGAAAWSLTLLAVGLVIRRARTRH